MMNGKIAISIQKKEEYTNETTCYTGFVQVPHARYSFLLHTIIIITATTDKTCYLPLTSVSRGQLPHKAFESCC
jgi:hypothetical protein